MRCLLLVAGRGGRSRTSSACGMTSTASAGSCWWPTGTSPRGRGSTTITMARSTSIPRTILCEEQAEIRFTSFTTRGVTQCNDVREISI
jgi:hypothetical protein